MALIADKLISTKVFYRTQGGEGGFLPGMTSEHPNNSRQIFVPSARDPFCDINPQYKELVAKGRGGVAYVSNYYHALMFVSKRAKVSAHNPEQQTPYPVEVASLIVPEWLDFLISRRLVPQRDGSKTEPHLADENRPGISYGLQPKKWLDLVVAACVEAKFVAVNTFKQISNDLFKIEMENIEKPAIFKSDDELYKLLTSLKLDIKELQILHELGLDASEIKPSGPRKITSIKGQLHRR